MKRRKWMRRICLLAACLMLSGCSGREEVPAQKQKETQSPVTETQTQKEETTEGTTESTTMFEFPTEDEEVVRNPDRYVADLSKESGIDIHDQQGLTERFVRFFCKFLFIKLGQRV
ncbi:MAG: hypothetical protein IJM26_06075 [Lachnospiraceae bacterium]|nr:hypothetical protein [Lachnospiraceae bacterium]